MFLINYLQASFVRFFYIKQFTETKNNLKSLNSQLLVLFLPLSVGVIDSEFGSFINIFMKHLC